MSDVETKLDQILEKLNWLFPDVWVLPANSLEMDAGLQILQVNQICYITTDFEQSDYTLKFKMQDGKEFYSRNRLGEIEKKLKSNPRFMRSHKSYLINLSQISYIGFSKARDLWFSNFDDPIRNCVTLLYLDEFKRRFEAVFSG